MHAKYVKTICEFKNDYSISLFGAIADEQMADVLKVPVGSNQLITIVGYHLPTTKVLYDFSGVWEKTEKYGYRFKAEEFFFITPNNKSGIIELLCSPLIKHVGTKIAEKIYARFGELTLEIIEYDWMQLTEVKGINEKKAESIHNDYISCKGVNTVFRLVGNAFSFAQATKIYSIFKDKSEQIIKEDPYRLKEIHGVTFAMLDSLGKKYINKKEFPSRILTAASIVLSRCVATGSSGMPSDLFVKETVNLLNRNGAYMEEIDARTCMTVIGKACTKSCENDNKNKIFVLQDKLIFLKQYADVENFIANKIKTMLSEEFHIPCDVDVDDLILKFEEKNEITFDEIQKEAIKKCFSSNISIITGGPGTGKSTIVKAILFIQHEMKKGDTILLAPTGRAAKRLSEATGEPASTIHSALFIRPNEDGTVLADEEELDADLIVVDEMSMTDMFVMKCLCQNISLNTRLVLVGDSNQLPSVGAGNVLRDLIDSWVIPFTELKSIFRQENGSMIIDNAMKIRDGHTNILSGKDFFIVPADNIDIQEVKVLDKEYKVSRAVNKAISLYMRAIKKYGIDEVALLVPYRKQGYCASVKNLNPLIQSIVNGGNQKSFIQIGDTKFLPNDRVMQTKNIKASTESGETIFVSNGEIGSISRVCHYEEPPDDDSVLLYVKYDEDTVGYTKEMLQHLELAYCSTVHKSQGMEYKCVLLLLLEEHSLMLKRRVIYTGITRGKECVCLIGEKKAIVSAIQNNNDQYRITMLKDRLEVA